MTIPKLDLYAGKYKYKRDHNPNQPKKKSRWGGGTTLVVFQADYVLRLHLTTMVLSGSGCGCLSWKECLVAMVGEEVTLGKPGIRHVSQNKEDTHLAPSGSQCQRLALVKSGRLPWICGGPHVATAFSHGLTFRSFDL